MSTPEQTLRQFKSKSFDLAWITVKNFEEAIKFYSEVLGLEQKDYAPEYKWAEFEGYAGGARLGICEICEDSPIEPGDNAVISFTVDDLDAACDFLGKKGTEFIGTVQEVPGHVKMQLIKDPSGNLIHICQVLHN
jgi:predicted enzyme related to lactoylglutathione lyase